MGLLVLTGASGSGKTTIATAVGRVLGIEVDVHHFDSIGVPSPSAMIAGWGSGEAWQRAMTAKWLKRFSARSGDAPCVLFEGQMRPSFLSAGLAGMGPRTARALLVDCDDDTRRTRLAVDRAQPELATDDMMRWAALMRREAVEMRWRVLDTSRASLDDAVSYVVAMVRAP